jgi:hypothetical protein
MHGNHGVVTNETHPPYLNRSATPFGQDDTQHFGSFTADLPATGMKGFS